MYLCRKHGTIGLADTCPWCLVESNTRVIEELKEGIIKIRKERNNLAVMLNTAEQKLGDLKPYIDISDEEISFRQSEIIAIVSKLIKSNNLSELAKQQRRSAQRTSGLSVGDRLFG